MNKNTETHRQKENKNSNIPSFWENFKTSDPHSLLRKGDFNHESI